MNEILLRRKKKIIIEDAIMDSSTNYDYVAAINRNIESLGYIFSLELFNRLAEYTKEHLVKFYFELIPALKKLRGDNVSYRPMYPNFPDQVMGMSEFDLYMNALIHYLSGGKLVPKIEGKERFPLFEKGNIEVLELGGKNDLVEIFENLAGSKTSISVEDKEDLLWFFMNYDEVEKLLPEEMPNKEVATYVCSLIIQYIPDKVDIHKYIRTTTDILRLAAAMSSQDVSLAENPRFRNFTRKERRMLLQLVNYIAKKGDMKKYYKQWIRLGEKLHPREDRMRSKFPRACSLFQSMRDEEERKRINTFNRLIEKSLVEGNVREAMNFLEKRPGEYARRLDQMLRISAENGVTPLEVAYGFLKIANQVSVPVLLQVREHFLHRNDNLEYRVFFPKGSLAKSYNIHNELEPINRQMCNLIVFYCQTALESIFSKRKDMGKVYLSEEFKNYVVPFNQRSASKAMKTMVRGSRIKLSEEIKYLRGFIWWTNAWKNNYEDIVDIDLSAVVFSKDWTCLEHISWTNLRSEKIKACHSGDLINGGPLDGEGASEFLDINIEEVTKNGGRYIVYSLYSFNGQCFNELPNVTFGWMEREGLDSGEIFEPKTVTQKMDLGVKSTMCIPVIFDCQEREFIWCDMSTNMSTYSMSVENTLSILAASCYSVVNMSKPNLYDLIDMHISARGQRVVDKEDADLIFDVDEGITPYDLDVFMNEYL